MEEFNLIILEEAVVNPEVLEVEEELDHLILQEIQVLEMEYLEKEIQEELEQHVTVLMITDQEAEAEVKVKLVDNKVDHYQRQAQEEQV